MTSLVLRDYQALCIKAQYAAWQRGFYSNLNSLFTGAGKTEIFTHLLHMSLNLETERGLVLAPASLVTQTYARMKDRIPEFENDVTAYGYKKVPKLGYEIASQMNADARIVVGSVPTLIEKNPPKLDPITLDDIQIIPYGENYGIRRSDKSKRPYLISDRVDMLLRQGMFKMLIYDESHHAVSKSSLAMITRFWEIDAALKRDRTKLVGYTATAWRKDGIGLANVFQCISFSRSFQWGMDNNFLVPLLPPIRVHADINMEKTKVLKADNWTDLIVQAWEEKAKNRPTLGFGPSVEDSKELARAFQAKGYKFGFVDALGCLDGNGIERPKDFQKTLLRQLYNGEINGIINYGVFLEGTDCPPASCLIWARPVDDNPTITTQAIGRILRLYEGKTDALILDCTSQTLEILGGGTLAGYQYDEKRKEYIKAEDEEVTLTMVGEEDIPILDSRDMKKGEFMANGVIYSVGRTARKSGSNWNHNEENDVLTLGVSKRDMLVITAPFYTMSADLEYKANQLADTDPATYGKLMKAKRFFESYTLWHVQDEKLVAGNPIFGVRDSLNQLMDFVTVYISEFETVEAFYKKGKRWLYAPMTDKQAGKLRELGIQPNSYWKQGDVSQMITYLIAYKFNVLLRIGEMLLDCGPYLDVGLLKYNQELLQAMATVYKMKKGKAS